MSSQSSPQVPATAHWLLGGRLIGPRPTWEQLYDNTSRRKSREKAVKAAVEEKKQAEKAKKDAKKLKEEEKKKREKDEKEELKREMRKVGMISGVSFGIALLLGIKPNIGGRRMSSAGAEDEDEKNAEGDKDGVNGGGKEDDGGGVDDADDGSKGEQAEAGENGDAAAAEDEEADKVKGAAATASKDDEEKKNNETDATTGEPCGDNEGDNGNVAGGENTADGVKCNDVAEISGKDADYGQDQG